MKHAEDGSEGPRGSPLLAHDRAGNDASDALLALTLCFIAGASVSSLAASWLLEAGLPLCFGSARFATALCCSRRWPSRCRLTRTV